MLPQIKNILYATDLSDNARHALAYAASLAHRYGAKMIILHLLDEILLLLRRLRGHAAFPEPGTDGLHRK